MNEKGIISLALVRIPVQAWTGTGRVLRTTPTGLGAQRQRCSECNPLILRDPWGFQKGNGRDPGNLWAVGLRAPSSWSLPMTRIRIQGFEKGMGSG